MPGKQLKGRKLHYHICSDHNVPGLCSLLAQEEIKKGDNEFKPALKNSKGIDNCILLTQNLTSTNIPEA